MVDYHLFGLDPWGFHLTKIIFHVGSSVLVLLIASTILTPSSEKKGTGASLLRFSAALFLPSTRSTRTR